MLDAVRVDQITEQVRRTRRHEWVGPGWRPVTRGIHVPVDAADPWRAALLGWQAALPAEARFTHLTAARLRGWWLPPGTEQLPPVVALPPRSRRLRRSGLVALRRGVRAAEVLHEIRLDPAPDTLLACARDLGLLDLVCLVDAALARGDCTRTEILEVAAPGRPGVRRLRAAVARAGERSESIWEVLLRELHVACDVPVRQQREVFDADGAFLARGDLWVVGSRRLHEYDGAVHRDGRQHAADLRRDRALQRAGWLRRGYTKGDLLGRAVTVLADADEALGRAHVPSRVRAWHELLRESAFTSAGRARLETRMGAG